MWDGDWPAGVEPVLDCLHCSLQRGESHCYTVTLCGAVLHLAHRKWATLSTDPATELGLCLTIIVTLCNSSTICWSSNSLYDPKWSSPVMSSHVTSSRLSPVTTQICWSPQRKSPASFPLWDGRWDPFVDSKILPLISCFSRAGWRVDISAFLRVWPVVVRLPGLAAAHPLFSLLRYHILPPVTAVTPPAPHRPASVSSVQSRPAQSQHIRHELSSGARPLQPQLPSLHPSVQSWRLSRRPLVRPTSPAGKLLWGGDVSSLPGRASQPDRPEAPKEGQPRLSQGAKVTEWPQAVEQGRGLLLGGVELPLPQPPLPQRGQVPDERQGRLSHVRPDVLQQSSSGGQTSIQRLPDKTGKSLVQKITNYSALT